MQRGRVRMGCGEGVCSPGRPRRAVKHGFWGWEGEGRCGKGAERDRRGEAKHR
jgi:hypothetical protein